MAPIALFPDATKREAWTAARELRVARSLLPQLARKGANLAPYIVFLRNGEYRAYLQVAETGKGLFRDERVMIMAIYGLLATKADQILIVADAMYRVAAKEEWESGEDFLAPVADPRSENTLILLDVTTDTRRVHAAPYRVGDLGEIEFVPPPEALADILNQPATEAGEGRAADAALTLSKWLSDEAQEKMVERYVALNPDDAADFAPDCYQLSLLEMFRSEPRYRNWFLMMSPKLAEEVGLTGLPTAEQWAANQKETE